MRSLRDPTHEPTPTFIERVGAPVKASPVVIGGRSVHTLFPTRSFTGYVYYTLGIENALLSPRPSNARAK